MSPSRNTARTMNSSGGRLRDLAADALRRLGFVNADAIKGCVAKLGGICQRALQYHQAVFEEAEKPADPETVLDALARGRFAYGVRESVNLWDDLALATMLAFHDDQAVEVFRERFAQHVAGWQRRYAQREPYSFEDFVADLLLPRERSGPRIESYKGHGPLKSWLKQVFISICRKRRERRLAEPSAVMQSAGAEKEDDPAERVPTHEETPDERYARLECAERLKPVISECVEQLEPNRRTVLLMAIVDGMPQKRLAQLYGVPDYKITRLKQSALKQIADKFMETARRVARMGDEAVRQCIELLLAKFPAA